MSLATASRTIKFIQEAGTYTAEIVSPSGDIVQFFKGNDYSNPGQIYRDLEASPAKLVLNIVSSRAAEGTVELTGDCLFYVNNDLLTFDGNNESQNRYGGRTKHFKREKPNSNSKFDSLKIQKNLVTDFGGEPVTITIVAKPIVAGSIEEISANYIIPVSKASGNNNIVTIIDGNGSNFVIRNPGDTCVLTAKLYDYGGTEVTGGLTYKWEQAVNTETGWKTLSQTGASLTVSDSEITAYGTFRCTIFKDGEKQGTDVQGVLDATDPFVINCNPDPADESIKATGGTGKIIYKPVLVANKHTNESDTTVSISGKFSFDYVLKNAAGLAYERKTNAAFCENGVSLPSDKGGFEITRTQCINAGTNIISLEIYCNQYNGDITATRP